MSHTRRFQDLYQEMFRAVQAGDIQLADTLRSQLEELRGQTQPKPERSAIERLKSQLPQFALGVLDRTQEDIAPAERCNCINAAFNFHDPSPRWKTYSTGEFLERIQAEFIQLSSADDFNFGDLVVLWSRVDGGSWGQRSIAVSQINPSDDDFPYGLVFDHVAVRLTEDLVFHKPDPTPQSRYQIDFLSSVIAPTILNFGFEMTFHRPKVRARG